MEEVPSPSNDVGGKAMFISQVGDFTTQAPRPCSKNEGHAATEQVAPGAVEQSSTTTTSTSLFAKRRADEVVDDEVNQHSPERARVGDDFTDIDPFQGEFVAAIREYLTARESEPVEEQTRKESIIATYQHQQQEEHQSPIVSSPGEGKSAQVDSANGRQEEHATATATAADKPATSDVTAASAPDEIPTDHEGASASVKQSSHASITLPQEDVEKRDDPAKTETKEANQTLEGDASARQVYESSDELFVPERPPQDIFKKDEKATSEIDEAEPDDDPAETSEKKSNGSEEEEEEEEEEEREGEEDDEKDGEEEEELETYYGKQSQSSQTISNRPTKLAAVRSRSTVARHTTRTSSSRITRATSRARTRSRSKRTAKEMEKAAPQAQSMTTTTTTTTATRLKRSQEKKPKRKLEEVEDEDDDQIYEVERIINHKKNANGARTSKEFLVLWKGYPRSEATWEPVSYLTNAKEALNEYLASVDKEVENKGKNNSSKKDRKKAAAIISDIELASRGCPASSNEEMQSLRAILPASLKSLLTRQTQRVTHGQAFSTLTTSKVTVKASGPSSVGLRTRLQPGLLTGPWQVKQPALIAESFRPKSRTFLSSRFYPFAKPNYVFDCLVQDEPGALATIVPVLSNKGFNIESLAIGKSEFQDVSRMTIMLKGTADIPDDELSVAVEEVLEDMRDSPYVWSVEAYADTHEGLIGDELLLVEISVLGPEVVKRLHSGIEDITKLDSTDKEAKLVAFSGGLNSVPEERLQENLQSLTRLTERYGGKVLHANTNTCVAEL
ncbi:hypothetical protein KEM54_001224 [Ascosphaera aggregata]|nr:hypothetical protein KEM54_001224 [Ascosphaera aggregata]